MTGDLTRDCGSKMKGLKYQILGDLFHGKG